MITENDWRRLIYTEKLVHDLEMRKLATIADLLGAAERTTDPVIRTLRGKIQALEETLGWLKMKKEIDE